MSGPIETLRLELIDEDGSVVDLGLVRAEVEPRRGASGMVSAEGALPVDSDAAVARLVEAHLASVRGDHSLWRITQTAEGEPIVGRYELEALAWSGDRFSLLISRDALADPVIAREIPDEEEASEDGPK